MKILFCFYGAASAAVSLYVTFMWSNKTTAEEDEFKVWYLTFLYPQIVAKYTEHSCTLKKMCYYLILITYLGCINNGFFLVPCYTEWARNDIINPEFITLLINVTNSGLMTSFRGYSVLHGTIKILVTIEVLLPSTT